MKKLLLVFAFMAICSLAASATQVVTLTNFCDIWNLHVDHGIGPFPAKTFVWGDHDLNTVCGLGLDLDTVGQKHGLAATTPPNDIYGTGKAVYDISDSEGGTDPSVEFLIRCSATAGSSAAAYTGGTFFGGNFFIAEDTATCSGKPAPTRTGLKPMVPRQ